MVLFIKKGGSSLYNGTETELQLIKSLKTRSSL